MAEQAADPHRDCTATHSACGDSDSCPRYDPRRVGTLTYRQAPEMTVPHDRIVIDGVTGEPYVGTAEDIERESERYRSDDQPAQRAAWLAEQPNFEQAVDAALARLRVQALHEVSDVTLAPDDQIALTLELVLRGDGSWEITEV